MYWNSFCEVAYVIPNKQMIWRTFNKKFENALNTRKEYYEMLKLYHTNLMLEYMKLIEPKSQRDIYIITENIYLVVQECFKRF